MARVRIKGGLPHHAFTFLQECLERPPQEKLPCVRFSRTMRDSHLAKSTLMGNGYIILVRYNFRAVPANEISAAHVR